MYTYNWNQVQKVILKIQYRMDTGELQSPSIIWSLNKEMKYFSHFIGGKWELCVTPKELASGTRNDGLHWQKNANTQ